MSRRLLAFLLITLGPLLMLAEIMTYGAATILPVSHFIDWLTQHSPYHPLLLIFPLVGLWIFLTESMGGDKRG